MNRRGEERSGMVPEEAAPYAKPVCIRTCVELESSFCTSVKPKVVESTEPDWETDEMIAGPEFEI